MYAFLLASTRDILTGKPCDIHISVGQVLFGYQRDIAQRQAIRPVPVKHVQGVRIDFRLCYTFVARSL
jgi:hypothetical protein